MPLRDAYAAADIMTMRIQGYFAPTFDVNNFACLTHPLATPRSTPEEHDYDIASRLVLQAHPFPSSNSSSNGQLPPSFYCFTAQKTARVAYALPSYRVTLAASICEAASGTDRPVCEPSRVAVSSSHSNSTDDKTWDLEFAAAHDPRLDIFTASCDDTKSAVLARINYAEGKLPACCPRSLGCARALLQNSRLGR